MPYIVNMVSCAHKITSYQYICTMKTTAYTRGKYNKQQPKENKITFLIDNGMMGNLKQLSGIKNKSVSQVIRDAIQEYYLQMKPNSTQN
jgi:hypothetical protein